MLKRFIMLVPSHPSDHRKPRLQIPVFCTCLSKNIMIMVKSRINYFAGTFSHDGHVLLAERILFYGAEHGQVSIGGKDAKISLISIDNARQGCCDEPLYIGVNVHG